MGQMGQNHKQVETPVEERAGRISGGALMAASSFLEATPTSHILCWEWLPKDAGRAAFPSRYPCVPRGTTSQHETRHHRFLGVLNTNQDQPCATLAPGAQRHLQGFLEPTPHLGVKSVMVGCSLKLPHFRITQSRGLT